MNLRERLGTITFGSVKAAARRLLGTLAWLGLLVIIGLGGAGIVNAMDHQPGSGARAELTSAGDREVVPLLDAATTDLSELADQVAALGVQARGALAALNGVDTATVDEAIAAGNDLVADLRVRSFALRRELAAVPYVGTPGVSIALAADLASRHVALVAAIDATEGLDDAWQRLTIGSVSAIRMSGLLATHDDLVVQAAADGRKAEYKDAMALLDQADATIAQARQLRNQLANTVDVTVLDQWLDRNADYDKALRALYKIDSTISGRVTDALLKARAAAKAAEAAARSRLPPDPRGLVVIMAEIGRGGMNGAVIAIEEARGKLIDAIAASNPPPAERGSTGEPGLSAEPGASATP
ncbi:MAG: hypothetical protein ACXWXR_07695 [Candidatus Limnocylindrales bacterium]